MKQASRWARRAAHPPPLPGEEHSLAAARRGPSSLPPQRWLWEAEDSQVGEEKPLCAGWAVRKIQSFSKVFYAGSVTKSVSCITNSLPGSSLHHLTLAASAFILDYAWHAFVFLIACKIITTGADFSSVVWFILFTATWSHHADTVTTFLQSLRSPHHKLPCFRRPEQACSIITVTSCPFHMVFASLFCRPSRSVFIMKQFPEM